MRIAREVHPNAVHHIISRFVDREWFFRDVHERERYFELLGHALTASDWRCLAYAIMSNHIHFAMLPGECSLESWAKAVHSPFAKWMNKRYDRIGPMFADRPASHANETRDDRDIIAYIHNNPVRAGVVSRASESPWTSHRAFLGLAPRPPWLHVDEALARCEFEDVAAFDEWVTSSTDIEIDVPSIDDVASEVQRRGAIKVGTPSEISVPLVRRPFGVVRPDPREIISLVAELTGVDVGLLCSQTTRRHVSWARQIAVHVALRYGVTCSEIAAGLGVTPQSTSRLSRLPLSGDQVALRDAIEQVATRDDRFTTTIQRK